MRLAEEPRPPPPQPRPLTLPPQCCFVEANMATEPASLSAIWLGAPPDFLLGMSSEALPSATHFGPKWLQRKNIVEVLDAATTTNDMIMYIIKH